MKKRKDIITGIEFIFVKGGSYIMGDEFGYGGSNEKPLHEVFVDDFYIGKNLVTQEQWQIVMGSNPSRFKTGLNLPVEQVSWEDAQKFISTLNEQTDGKYRLPTEAEWEYAARSRGGKQMWAGTSDESKLGLYAWYSNNSEDKTHPVGLKLPNGLGIYDMSGNVWEWVSDWYDEDAYSKHKRNNPINNNSGRYRVVRGGGWYYDSECVRCSNRNYYAPDIRYFNIGFRLLRTV
jgi:formylglycine-generating enzyme required for sulfatase activity